ncbi:MAG TPA: hypothetical protein PLJ13_16420 [Cyclobacteriaceae bacterium]|nr:hypothetical protein [Cyclobacteriaceae bacterium]
MSTIKTVGSYEGFVELCSGYRGYNPGSPNLTVSALRELSVKARQTLEAFNVAKSEMSRVTNDREIAFAGLPKLVSGISFALAASGASEQTMKDVRAFLRQMTSRKKSRDPIPSGQSTEPESNRPFSQRGYEAMTNHFAQLVQLVSLEPKYQPNEAHLTLAGLQEAVSNLRSLNQAVNDARATLSHARLALRQVISGEVNSVVTTARAAKKYLRSVYGLNSNEYSQVREIKFNKTFW